MSKKKSPFMFMLACAAVFVVVHVFLSLPLLAETSGAETSGFSSDLASKKMGASDVAFLIDGVDGLEPTGLPGPLCVFGENAAALIAGHLGPAEAPLVAAAKFGDGRIVLFGHDGYLNPGAFTKREGSERFVKNIFRWLSSDNPKAEIAVFNKPQFADTLESFGYPVKRINRIQEDDLKGVKILLIDGARIPENQIVTLTKFVENGGGIMSGSLGWGWLQISGKTDLKTEHPGNVLFAPMGIVWANGMIDPTPVRSRTGGRGDQGVKLYRTVPGGPSPYLNLDAALKALDEHEKGTKILSSVETATVSNTIENGLRSVPAEFADRFASLEKLAQKEVVPRPNNRIRKNTMISDIIAMTLQTEKFLKSQLTQGFPEGGVQAFKAAADFPGAVPANAKTLEKTFEIDTKIPDWHSLGLYAAPGATISVRVPKDSLPQNARGKSLALRIGAHKDLIYGANEWSRYPEITLEIPLKSEETKVANPFGGLVYIVVPRNFGTKTVSVQISGCVESPLYVHGKTTLEDWKNSVRNTPGPWGELASDRVVISLPSTHLRELDDPDKVMEFWDAVLDACADLCGEPIKRTRPERIVCDRQISAGYMHSGYPVMTHMDVEGRFTKLKDDPKDGWGFFHEFGHNHQSREWTFEGTGEVTVNLFTVYVFETVCNIKKEDSRNTLTPTGRKRLREAHFAAGSPFDKWKNDPFLALVMYIDIQDEFGWEPFKKVFREYRKLRPNERPRTEEEKRDQWMLRMSKMINRNLGPYFDKWGVPVTEAAKESIKDLPGWNPYGEGL